MNPTLAIVGLDPGVTTGWARWDVQAARLTECRGYKIHEAMRALEADRPALVLFEDARQRRWFGKMDAEQRKYGAAVREGAGSVKRDCSIWADFLEDLGIPYIARPPLAGGTKWSALYFKAVTGWDERTNEHARDAAVLVAGLNAPMVQSLIRQHEQRAALPPSKPRRRARRAA